MAKNSDNIRVYGDLSSEVFLAAKGTALPLATVALTADPAGFKGLGWVSEDGVNLSISTDVEKFKGWQGGAPLRTKVTSVEKTFTVTALEEAPAVTELYYGHAPVTAANVTGTGAAAVAKIDLPEGIGTVEKAAVIRFVDGGVTKLLCCSNVQVSERGEAPHTNSDITAYEFTFDIIGASYILTNAPAYTQPAV